MMVNSTKNQNRREKEHMKWGILNTINWMYFIIQAYKLTRKICYLSILIFHKCMLLQSKKKDTIIDNSIQLLSFTSILLASKIDNIHGNFIKPDIILKDG